MSKLRFDFLDGFRGLAAMWVVFFHSLHFNGYSIDKKLQLSEDILLLRYFETFLSLGQLAVAIFIVLSGFCLAIPVVNSNLELKGGFKRYISRRAKRLIPPYYIALVISLVMIAVFPLLQVPQNTAWDSKIPVTVQDIIVHVLLIHNLDSSWIHKINGAHWSIATEWQIYFLFPVMLFLWRKYSMYLSLLVFVVITLILQFIVPFAVPEFILLFFMGVISCYYSFKANKSRKKLIYMATLVFIGSLALQIIKPMGGFASNIIVGFAFSFLIYTLTSYKRLHAEVRYLLLENPSTLFLGRISYSLYLIHGPFLALGNLYLLENFEMSRDNRQLLLFGFILFVILPITTVFYHLVEKKFLNK
ncbi:acyltransferase [Sphingobacterium phlebotomi]|uniref:Acyltransferase n=1 Tax=Sphingobacterium phlebotomi TaxID=2605433 RepID=A0A5D4HDK3_9SPHI|nr:acyltransferase [Sphingobacterium phlebotomi]TYR36890.1 acyltransferase [Sphingobacterium phlebotomi]